MSFKYADSDLHDCLGNGQRKDKHLDHFTYSDVTVNNPDFKSDERAPLLPMESKQIFED